MAKPLALTIGEPAGIGPDITLEAWLRRHELKLPAFYLLGDRDLLHNRAKALGLKIKLADVSAENALDAFANALPVVATGRTATAQPGQPDDTSADAALVSIRQAVSDVISGRPPPVVPHPIPQTLLSPAPFPHPPPPPILA